MIQREYRTRKGEEGERKKETERKKIKRTELTNFKLHLLLPVICTCS
jgi:hypothetical protein